MNKRYLIAAALGVLSSIGAVAPAAGQRQFPSATPAPAAQRSAPANTSSDTLASTAIAQASGPTNSAAGSDPRSEIYYDFTMGTLFEREYEATNKSEDATQAIEYYKKAYALDSSSGAIGEQLAEMYFVAQRIRDAVVEAQSVIRRDPTNLPARRLLARIYIRSLGELTNSAAQKPTVAQAVTQLQEIVRLDSTDTESSLWLARLDRLTNANDDAERVLREVLARDTENESAVEQLTQLLMDEGKLAPAVELLQQTLQRAPSATLYDQLGDAYTQMHDAANAEQAYAHAVELEPDQAGHVRGLAQSLFDQGKYQQALEQYQRLTQLEPQEAENHLRLSDIYRQLRQLDKAEEQILLAKQRAPGNLEVIYDEAGIYQAEGRFEDAVRVLSDAVTAAKAQTEFTPERQRTLAILYQALGQVYRDQRNYSAAVNTYREMSALGPEEDERGRGLIIDTYRGARDLPHAFDEAKKAVAAYPKDRSLHVSQAMLYGENNQPDQAAQVLRPMLDGSANDLDIYLDLAEVFLLDQRYSDAEQSARSAEKLATRSSDRETIGFMLGGVYERQKKYDQAEQVFKGVLAINPRNAMVLNYYGYILADRGVRLDEAVGLVQRALAEEPDNPAYLDSLGWAYYKQNKLMEAEAYLRKAVQRESTDPTMLSHLGDVLAKNGQADLAVMEWEKSLTQWHLALPADFEADKVAEIEHKLSDVKKRVAQQKPAEDKSR